MIGKLFNAANGWIVVYHSEFGGGSKILPLHHSSVNPNNEIDWDLFKKEGGTVEFDIVSDYSEKENKEIECAKLKIEIKEKEEESPTISDDFQISPDGAYEHQDWSIIFQGWSENETYLKTIFGLQEYLEKNFSPPLPK